MSNANSSKTLEHGYDLKGHKCTFTIGDEIRCWDFEQMPGREEAFIEGIFTGYAPDGRLVVEVEKDTLYPATPREEIFTAPFGKLFFGEWNGRITLLKNHIINK